MNCVYYSHISFTYQRVEGIPSSPDLSVIVSGVGRTDP